MGAWGHRVFDNDGALDWVHAFLEGADLEEALALPGDEAYLDVDDGSMALAAAEVVAAINGHPSNDLPNEVALYLHGQKTRPSKRRTTLALRAIERVLGDHSELKQLWDEGGDMDWTAVVRDLRDRLSAPPIARTTPSEKSRRTRPARPEIRTILDLPSPTGAYRFELTEIDSPAGANTQGGLTFRTGGSGLFMVMGTGLGISAKWVGDSRLEISIPASLSVQGPLGDPEARVQHFNERVDIVYRR